MTIGDGISTSYFRQQGDRILMGLGSEARLPLGDLESDEEDIPADIVQLARERLAERLIGAESARPVGGRTGPITLTTDDLPIVDRHPEVRGLHFFAGDCGSSFKTAPALGCALAEWAVLGQPAIADVSALSLSRFAVAAT